MRERMQPKLGKMDIDYQVLHDAFFKYQTKPQLSIYGDVYYENKEIENKMKIFKPGRISEKLRVALGIPENSPPPWIINMQRYGPPPSYSNLKIPGVNAPICDPTADITPNLWTPPILDDKPSLVYDFHNDKAEHWGDLHEAEEEVSEDLDENVSVSDNEERPNVENIFDKNANASFNYANTTSTSFNTSNEIAYRGSAIPNPNANVSGMSFNPNADNLFFTVLEQKAGNVKQNEIFGSNYTYAIPNKTEKEEKKDTENIEINKEKGAKESKESKEKKKEKIKFKF